MIRLVSVMLGLALLCGASAAAQPRDTVRRDTAKPLEVFTEFQNTKSPGLAILYGVFPGGGQIYTEQYWKAPIVFGAALFLGWRVWDLTSKFNEQADLAASLPDTSAQLSRVRQLREQYRDDRDMNFIYFLAVEALGMIDAYVGVYLYDFNVEGVAGDAKLGVLPTPDGMAPALKLRVQF